ncbi:MAG: hypothetical protein ABIK92_14450 [Pseudomonadota bacterium]
MADTAKYKEFIKKVSEEISNLKEVYPQLKEFSIDKHTDIENLRVDYSYHTHDSKHSAGWISGVPNPDPDGIWLYIDLHDKDSMAQIHTQPITGISLQVYDKNVCFLVLEGSKTKSVADKIYSILEKSGAKSSQHK